MAALAPARTVSGLELPPGTTDPVTVGSHHQLLLNGSFGLVP